MKEFVISEVKAETAVLVGLITQEQDEAKTKEYLDELEFLADTAGAVTVKRFTQKVQGPSQVTYVGKGKLEEIKQYIKMQEDAADDDPTGESQPVGMVIFDDELSAKQMRNIEAELKVKILDRTSLILDIFAMRAQTAEAKTQVELAQYRYMLPRLQRLWTHLERQGGGSGSGGGKGSVGLRGPGETQLEMDRRIILHRITLLKQRLVEIDKQKTTQRKNRGRLIRVALVGYTNVGKSTMMNLLSKSDVFAENKLFATLDTTVRKMVIDNLPFLLADTVGFIRKLPTHLVESFKSTLDEVREADILVHIVDISHPTFEDQIKVVEQTLNDVCKNEDEYDERRDDRNGYNRKDKKRYAKEQKEKGHEKPVILIFNKVDAYNYVPKDEDDLSPMKRENISLDELKQTWMARMSNNCIFISAKEGTGIAELKTLLYNKVKEIHTRRFPYNDFLFQHYEEDDL